MKNRCVWSCGGFKELPDRWVNVTPVNKSRVFVARIIRPRPSCMPKYTKTVWLDNEPPEQPNEVSCAFDKQKRMFRFVGRCP